VRRFFGEWPVGFEPELMKYLTRDDSFGVAASLFPDPVMDKERFLSLADEFRSPHLWERSGGECILRHQVA